MAKIPLDFEPGSNYKYSLCHDVLAAVVEVASGMRFSEYLQKNVFDPLGMVDIGFRPNDSQKARFCDQYIYSNGTNTVVPRELKNQYALSPNYESGGAGLFSTVDEYMKFITVLANGGKTEDGYSLLRPETIEMLGVNRLHDTALNSLVNGRLFGYGWGLCGRAHRDPTISLSKSPVGEFGWDGAAGALSMVDAKNHIALYFGVHIFNFTYGYYYLHPMIRNMVYEALEI
jgi:CubicO group peptidase (beta-lactamase class C family)